jgi:signal peptidase
MPRRRRGLRPLGEDPPREPGPQGRRSPFASKAAGGLGRLVLLAGVLVLAATFVPSLLGYERYVLVGHSMEPTIHKGSLVFDEIVPVGALRQGDVITYIPPASREPVTHRLLEITRGPHGERVFRTKGDNNAAADLRPFTLDEPRQARVAFAIPHLGWIFILLAMQEARILLIALPGVLLALWALHGVWRQGGELLAAERERS